MSEAKLISYTLNDFSTEIEMESFLHFSQVTRFEGNCEVEISKGLQDLDLKFK